MFSVYFERIVVLIPEKDLLYQYCVDMVLLLLRIIW